MNAARFALPLLSIVAALALPAPAGAAVVGDAASCAAGRPSLKVRVSGFQREAGLLRIALYERGGWLKKGGSLKKLKVPVTSGSLDVCVSVPGPGTYALAVHHDIAGDKKRDRSDGAGASRNPHLSLMSRPSFTATGVAVGDGVRPIEIELRYLHGLSFGPARRG